MGFSIRLLKFAAKVGLDKLIGQNRTDEAIELYQEWASGGSPDEIERQVADAKREAADTEMLAQAVDQAIAAATVPVSREQRDALAFTLSSGISALPDAIDSGADAARLLEEKLLPGKAKTYVVWLDLPQVVGAEGGRYCHFYWDGKSYRIRDYIGGRIFHPAGQKVTDKDLQPVSLDLTVLEVWSASRGRVQCLKRFGLSFPVTEGKQWRERLELLRAAAAALKNA